LSAAIRRYRTSKYTLTNLRTAEGAVVLADDYADANGKSIMSFAQAQSAARRTSQTKNSGAGTVAEAMDECAAASADAKGRTATISDSAGYRRGTAGAAGNGRTFYVRRSIRLAEPARGAKWNALKSRCRPYSLFDRRRVQASD
jgi:hypothetical protein